MLKPKTPLKKMLMGHLQSTGVAKKVFTELRLLKPHITFILTAESSMDCGLCPPCPPHLGTMLGNQY